jgi:hypothetical protein
MRGHRLLLIHTFVDFDATGCCLWTKGPTTRSFWTCLRRAHLSSRMAATLPDRIADSAPNDRPIAPSVIWVFCAPLFSTADVRVRSSITLMTSRAPPPPSDLHRDFRSAPLRTISVAASRSLRLVSDLCGGFPAPRPPSDLVCRFSISPVTTCPMSDRSVR